MPLPGVRTPAGQRSSCEFPFAASRSRGNSRCEPRGETLHTFTDPEFRAPSARLAQGSGIRNVPRLVPGPPCIEASLRPSADDLLDEPQQLPEAQRVRRAATQVEGPSAERIDVFDGEQIGANGIVDIEHVADLIA